MEKVVGLCKRRGFIFQSAEIYGGFRSTYDYGPLGVNLLRNVKNAWWEAMVQRRDDVVGLDAAILSPPAVWEASGHLATFTDPLVDCRNCHQRWREDKIDGVCPALRLDRVHRGPRLQPDVQDPRRPPGGRGRGRLPPPRDGPGHVHQLRQRAPDHPDEAALRHRPGGQVLPQRDHPAELRLPHPRVRADGDGVLRPAGRGRAVVRVLAGRAVPLVPRPRASPPTSCACATTTPTSCPTTRRPPPTWSSSSRGAGTSSRASPTAPTSTCRPTPPPRASSSSTSTRPPASATSPTSSSRPPGPPGR